MVNICHEARSIAHNAAQCAGHLIFQDTQGACTPHIYFRPEIDTLFVYNEKDYWIRDWGPEGILTELWMIHHSERLHFLTIDLESLTRATTSWSLLVDLS